MSLEQDPKPEVTEAQIAEIRAVEAEIEATKKKIWTAEDPDIGDALKMQLGALIGRHDKLVRIANGMTIEEEEQAARVPLSPADQRNVDQLVRAAKLEASRQNQPRFYEIVGQIRAIDPDNPEVLELLADELIAKSNFTDAVMLLKKAKQSSPNSLSIERKLGLAAMQHGSEAFMSFEDKLRSDLKDDPLILNEFQRASAPWAFSLTVFLPGSGHVVLGKTPRGWIIMGSWALMVFFVFLLRDQLSNLVRTGAGAGRGDNGSLVTFPIVIAVIIHLFALGELAQMRKLGGVHKNKVTRPVPPSNLPFE